jgi:hypothetical protein
MRRSCHLALAAVLASVLFVPAASLAGGLEGFLDDVEVRASADLTLFKSDLRVTFGVSSGKIDGLFAEISRPSDVYMCLRVGEVAGVPVDRVVAEYKKNRGQGWGVLAKSLGIKPGSEEFHALKAGRLPAHSGDGSSPKTAKHVKGRK